MRRLFVTAVAGVLASVAQPAAAVEWLCNLSDDLVQLVCIADPDLAAPELNGPVQRHVVRGVHYPLDESREHRIALWTPPTDPEFVAELAQATLCARQTDCSALLVPGPWQMRVVRPRAQAWRVGSLR